MHSESYNFVKVSTKKGCINVFFFRKLVVGDPKTEGTFMGALISKEHLAKVKGYVDVARQEGASILSGDDEINLSPKNKNVRT